MWVDRMERYSTGTVGSFFADLLGALNQKVNKENEKGFVRRLL